MRRGTAAPRFGSGRVGKDIFLVILIEDAMRRGTAAPDASLLGSGRSWKGIVICFSGFGGRVVRVSWVGCLWWWVGFRGSGVRESFGWSLFVCLSFSECTGRNAREISKSEGVNSLIFLKSFGGRVLTFGLVGWLVGRLAG